MTFRIQEEPERSEEIHAAVRRGIPLADPADVGPRNWQALHLSLRDPDSTLVGGLYGATSWGWLMIDGLWVDHEGHAHFHLRKTLRR
jgi:hypothetical protein